MIFDNPINIMKSFLERQFPHVMYSIFILKNGAQQMKNNPTIIDIVFAICISRLMLCARLWLSARCRLYALLKRTIYDQTIMRSGNAKDTKNTVIVYSRMYRKFIENFTPNSPKPIIHVKKIDANTGRLDML